jgi:hypothetical protein
MTVPDFLSHWGGAPTAPQVAMRLATDEPWTIATRPRNPVTSVKQRLSLNVGEGRARVRFSAQITPIDPQSRTSANILQYRLDAPRGLEIEKVSLLQDGIERVSRWIRDESERLTVFLSSPASGRQQLVLDGWLPAPRDGTFDVPRIDVESAGRRDTSLFIYRQPDVLVAIASREGLGDAERSPTSLDPWAPGRLVAALAARSDEYSASLRVGLNSPHVQSVQVASIAPGRDGWEGRIDYQCAVDGGSLDVIVIRLPPQWNGPFEASPGSTLEISSSSGGDRRLTIRPQASIEGEFHCTIRGPLTLAEGDSISPPTIVTVAGEETASYLLLPSVAAGERFTWKTTGLVPESLPEGRSPSVLPAGYKSYRVTDPAAAASRASERLGSEPNASTADIRTAWNMAGLCQGIATFLVSGAEGTDCVCAIPEGLDVLELRRSGLAVTPERVAGGWHIPLAEGEEQQTIEIVYRAAAEVMPFSGRVVLPAPSLTHPEVARTTWTVFSPAAAGPIVDADTRGQGLAEPQSAHAEPPADEPLALSMALGRRDRWSFAGSTDSLVIRGSRARPLEAAWNWLLAGFLAAMGVVLARRGPGDSKWGLILAPSVLGISLLATSWLDSPWSGAVLVVASTLVLLVLELRRPRAVGGQSGESGSP